MAISRRQAHRRRAKNISRKQRGGTSPPTFHFMITTGGRPILKDMLESLKGELKNGDAVTVFFDGENALENSGFTEEWRNGFEGRLHTRIEKDVAGYWGHGLRTKHQAALQPKTTFVLHGDDDDVYKKGFLDILRKKCTDPETLYIAKMDYKAVEGDVVPKGTEIKLNDIGTPNGIIPYDIAGKGEWMPRYGGDFSYYEKIGKLAKKVEFLPDIIYTVMSNPKDRKPFLTHVFYHIYCNRYTMPIVRDQVTKIIYSGLYQEVSNVHCFLSGEKEYIEPVSKFLRESGAKFKIDKVGVGDMSFERFTMNDIPRYIGENDLFLYIHSKGVSERHSAADNVYWWRNWMEYNLIFKFRECIEALKDHDIVGVGYTTKMIGPHFSGNFWWTKAPYFNTLPKNADGSMNIGNNYYDPESFIFKGKDPKHLDIDEGRAAHPDTDYYSYKEGLMRIANNPQKKGHKKGGARRRRTR